MKNMTLAIAMTLVLAACGGSTEPDATVETEDEETVFDPMTVEIEKAKAAEDSALQHKEDIDKALEEVEGSSGE
ncbi:MAG TPA: hypothetical protein VNQ14_14510 [Woeseiaceae bacterium]|nr:hypothetical protein [Woeseiaceae bacterium]